MAGAARLFDLLHWKDRLVELQPRDASRKLIISVLLHRPEVIVVDEYVVGLDPKAAKVLKDLFREYRRGHTILMSTHTLESRRACAIRWRSFKAARSGACGTMTRSSAHATAGEEGLEDIFLRLTGDNAARAVVEVLDA